MITSSRSVYLTLNPIHQPAQTLVECVCFPMQLRSVTYCHFISICSAYIRRFPCVFYTFTRVCPPYRIMTAIVGVSFRRTRHAILFSSPDSSTCALLVPNELDRTNCNTLIMLFVDMIILRISFTVCDRLAATSLTVSLRPI